VENQQDKKHALGVAVVTPAGTFPSNDDYRRAFADERVETFLAVAAAALKLTNTADWVVMFENREIDQKRTFREEALTCVVEIEWHKREGGGGA
jgi:hypothetical protein